MPRIDIGTITLNVEERGEGPAFIFIPGLVGLLNAWDYQLAHFSARFRCISFDHRGCGDSDKPRDSYSTGKIAADVIALMDRLGIDRAVIAGTSTGGCVLQNLAIDHPDRLVAAVFSNPGSRPTSTSRACRRRGGASRCPTGPTNTSSSRASSPAGRCSSATTSTRF